jgi:sarcosine oxidase subunit gamma
MADAPPPASALAALSDRLPSGSPDLSVALGEQLPRAQLNLRLDPGDASAREAARKALGFALPLSPNVYTSEDNRAALWLGPDEWLVTGPASERDTLERSLRHSLGGYACALTDVSAMRTILSLSGPDARNVLMKGCRLDFHPRNFRPGNCVQTALAQAQVIIRQTDDRPGFELFVRNSFAVYLATWLLDAMTEYLDGP